MNASKRNSSALPIAFVVVMALCIGLAWWLAGSGDTPPAPVVATPAVKAAPAAAPETTPPPTAQPSATAPEQAAPMAPQPAVALTPAQQAEEQALLEADYRVGNIIGAEKTVEATRDKLLLLYPSFNKAEKIKAAPHLVNLVEDEQLPRLLPFMMSPLTPADAQETIFNDMLNRPPQVGWPVLIDVIAQPKHPLSARAKELLTTIVGGDHGDNIAAWQQALKDQLAAQGIETGEAEQATAASGAAPM